VTSGPAVTFSTDVTLYTEVVNPMTRGSAAVLREGAEQSDEHIVRQVLDGNTALFELLMRRYNERLYRAARAITRDDREAEDVIQQAYVNAFSNLRQFKGHAQFATWLTRIAVHEALARVRRRRRYTTMDPENSFAIPFPVPRSSMPDPERQAFARELGALLESAIDRLPDGAREVFVLRQLEDMDTAEVAAVLNVSDAVVKTRFSRARAALRRDLYQHAEIASSNAFKFLRPRCDRLVAAVLHKNL